MLQLKFHSGTGILKNTSGTRKNTNNQLRFSGQSWSSISITLDTVKTLFCWTDGAVMLVKQRMHIYEDAVACFVLKGVLKPEIINGP